MGLAFVVAVVCALCQVNDAFHTALSVPPGRRRPLLFVIFGLKKKLRVGPETKPYVATGKLGRLSKPGVASAR